jgi:hypothetical protein
VFTARFSIDTSGLDIASAHADAVAAHIASILPHSPAKKGPLAFRPSFMYIADAADAMADRLEGIGSRGMAAIAAIGDTRWDGGRAGGSGGDIYNVSIDVHAAPGMDEESLANAVMGRFTREMNLKVAS